MSEVYYRYCPKCGDAMECYENEYEPLLATFHCEPCGISGTLDLTKYGETEAAAEGEK